MAASKKYLEDLSPEALLKRKNRFGLIMNIVIVIMLVSLSYSAYLLFAQKNDDVSIYSMISTIAMLAIWLPAYTQYKAAKDEVSRRG
ncbi:MAG: hypothetical protein AB8H47_19490 [Bacteroidia bacterium]